MERSTDGLHFDGAGTVAGKGGPGNTYQFKDPVTEPVLYYRIKITSLAGNSFYSKTIVLKDNDSRTNYIRLMNNPVTGIIALQAAADKPSNLQVTLTDLSGKELLYQSIQVLAGINQLNIVVPAGCSRGIYILRAAAGQLHKTMRVMIVQ